MSIPFKNLFPFMGDTVHVQPDEIEPFTATCVPFADANGHLTEDSAFTFNSTTNVLTATGGFSGPISATDLATTGNTDIGNAATDTLTVNAVVDSDLTFIKEVNRSVSVGTTTTAATAGATLGIAAGAGATTGAGGALTIAGGAAPGAGAGGAVNVNGGASASGTAGAVNLGAANTSAITIGAPISSATVSFTKETGHTLNVAQSTTPTAVGANLTIAAGDAEATGATGGNLTLNGGIAAGGTSGQVLIGAANTSSVTITPNLACNGNVGLGNAAADTISLTGTVDTDVTFLQEVAREIKVAQSTTGAAVGANLTVSAGAAEATGATGGNLVLNAGDAAGGTDGQVQIGAANTSAVVITPSTCTVGGSQVVTGTIPHRTTIDCLDPDQIGVIGSVYGPARAMTVTRVWVRQGTPAGGSLSMNVRGSSGLLWAAPLAMPQVDAPTTWRTTTDDGVNYTDGTAAVASAGGATAAAVIDTVANGDWIVVGALSPFDTVTIDMDGANVNAVASVLSVHYWNGAWTAVGAATDGTDNGGATLGKDGAIVFTPGADWVTNTIDGVTAYHVRLSVSAGPLTAGTAVDAVTVSPSRSYYYPMTPTQNTSHSANSILSVEITDADATAADISVIIDGNLT